jgi:hypothetical protein
MPRARKDDVKPVSQGSRKLAGKTMRAQAAVQWTANSSYTSTLASFGGLITANGTSWTNTGDVTVSAVQKAQCTPGGIIDTAVTLTSVPGTATQLGCALSANGQAN